MSRLLYSNCVFRKIGSGLLFVWALAVASPVNSAECPDGTRNNYKGQCIRITSENLDQKPISNNRDWIDPTIQSNEITNDAEESSSADPSVSGTYTADNVGESSSADPSVSGTYTADNVEESSPAESNVAATDITAEPKIISTDLARAVVTIQELRDEIKDLLNRIELQRYELDKLRGRQIDLYNDLDQRLTKQERLVLEVPLPNAAGSVETTELIETEKVQTLEPTLMSIEDAEDVKVNPVSGEQLTQDRSKLPDTESVVQEASLSSEAALEPTLMSVEDSGDTNTNTISEDTTESQPATLSKSKSAALPVPKVQEEGSEVVLAAGSELLPTDTELPQKVIMVENTDSQPVSQQIVKDIDEIDSNMAEEQVLPSVEPILTPEQTTSELANTVSVDEDVRSDSNLVKVQELVVSKSGNDASENDQSSDSQDNSNSLQLSTVVSLTEQDAYDQAFNLLKQSRYEEAAEQFASFLRQYRNSQLTDDAWYWMAEAHYVTRDFDRAIIAFNTVVDYFATSPRIPASRLKIGYIQYENEEYDAARQTLSELLSDFPAHRVAVSAEARLKKIAREGY